MQDQPDEVPAWLRAARSGWANNGAVRPPFAIEPGPGQESVWDYPRPPAIVRSDGTVVVGDPQRPVARSVRAVRILETASPPTWYVPSDDVSWEQLELAPGESFCEWKGRARYFALASDPTTVVAWQYPEPFADSAAVAGFVSFYPGRIDCTVDGERVRPQAGGFYGGWITDDVVGPFKGDPGTSGW